MASLAKYVSNLPNASTLNSDGSLYMYPMEKYSGRIAYRPIVRGLHEVDRVTRCRDMATAICNVPKCAVGRSFGRSSIIIHTSYTDVKKLST